MILKIIIFILFALVFLGIVGKHSKQWTLALQQVYIRKANHWFPGSGKDWESNWIRILFQISIIFLSIVLILIFFSFLFGTLYLE